MVRTQHTEWPVGRMPTPCNSVREGGLYYKDHQDGLVREARRLVRPRKPKDEVKEFCQKAWIIIGCGIIITLIFFYLNSH